MRRWYQTIIAHYFRKKYISLQGTLSLHFMYKKKKFKRKKTVKSTRLKFKFIWYYIVKGSLLPKNLLMSFTQFSHAFFIWISRTWYTCWCLINAHALIHVNWFLNIFNEDPPHHQKKRENINLLPIFTYRLCNGIYVCPYNH